MQPGSHLQTSPKSLDPQTAGHVAAEAEEGDGLVRVRLFLPNNTVRDTAKLVEAKKPRIAHSGVLT